MTTKDQTASKAQGTCTACQGKGQITQTKDGKTRTIRCINCRGTGTAGGYQTK